MVWIIALLYFLNIFWKIIGYFEWISLTIFSVVGMSKLNCLRLDIDRFVDKVIDYIFELKEFYCCLRICLPLILVCFWVYFHSFMWVSSTLNLFLLFFLFGLNKLVGKFRIIIGNNDFKDEEMSKIGLLIWYFGRVIDKFYIRMFVVSWGSCVCVTSHCLFVFDSLLMLLVGIVCFVTNLFWCLWENSGGRAFSIISISIFIFSIVSCSFIIFTCRFDYTMVSVPIVIFLVWVRYMTSSFAL